MQRVSLLHEVQLLMFSNRTLVALLRSKCQNKIYVNLECLLTLFKVLLTFAAMQAGSKWQFELTLSVEKENIP